MANAISAPTRNNCRKEKVLWIFVELIESEEYSSFR
jgi:hypothetical protein